MRASAMRGAGAWSYTKPGEAYSAWRVGRNRTSCLLRSQARYCSSLTFSIQSTLFPSSASAIAIWVIAVVAVAPCQCFAPGANQTISPGRISSLGPPSRCAQPQPYVTMSVWPSGCVLPSGAGARLECDDDTADTRGVAALEARVHPHRPGEVFGRPLVRRLRTSSSDLH